MKNLSVFILMLMSVSAQAAPGKCIFEKLDLDVSTIGESPAFVELKPKEDVRELLDLTPSMKKNFPDDFKISECKKSIMDRYYYSITEKKYYIVYTSAEDYCDGGNAYGFIVETNKNMKMHLKVVATVADSFINCK